LGVTPSVALAYAVVAVAFLAVDKYGATSGESIPDPHTPLTVPPDSHIPLGVPAE
jgi:AGZA family xanthine/uracil permease-like MFS transporter